MSTANKNKPPNRKPMGLAIGVAFGAMAAGFESATLTGAIALAIGIGIQNFPEGVAVSMVAILLLFNMATITKKIIAENNRVDLETEAAILIEANSGKVLFEKHPNKIIYPASLTKVATAIYAIEKGNIDDIVTVSKNARQADGTKVYLEEGEQVSLDNFIGT
ncbi:hypothetical protein WMO40_12700 [Bacillaceae bacterium CLA-AA-H227]|nr:hypothetical protein [Robertmurraya kyonggiensis]